MNCMQFRVIEFALYISARILSNIYIQYNYPRRKRVKQAYKSDKVAD